MKTRSVGMSDTFDDLDRALLLALRRNGRASWSELGQLLGVSDRTIARRWAQMRASGLVRLVGMTDPHVLGERQWYVRARAAPGTAVTIADALARRRDTSWVRIVGGGTELVWSARILDGHDAETLLLEKLPRIGSLSEVSTQSELRVYTRGAEAWLRRGEIEGRKTEPVVRPVDLDDLDRALLAALADDGRARIDHLASAAGVSANTVTRRVSLLEQAGVLLYHVEIDVTATDLMGSLLWVTVSPNRLDAVGAALAEHVEVGFAAATTGRTNLYVSVTTRDAAGLHTYLTRRLAPLEGVRDIESATMIRSVKGEAMPMPGTRR